MSFLPKWSLPYRLKLNGNIFVSQMPTLIPGIKVEFFAFLSERDKKKAIKLAGLWYFLHRLIVFQNFFFLVIINLVNQIYYCFLNRVDDCDFAQPFFCPRSK